MEEVFSELHAWAPFSMIKYDKVSHYTLEFYDKVSHWNHKLRGQIRDIKQNNSYKNVWTKNTEDTTDDIFESDIEDRRLHSNTHI